MCHRDAASVEAVSLRWADEVHVIGVASTGTSGDFVDFIAQHGLTFPSIEDGIGTIFEAYGIYATPATVVIDRFGAAEGLIGATDDEMLDALIRSVLGPSAEPRS